MHFSSLMIGAAILLNASLSAAAALPGSASISKTTTTKTTTKCTSTTKTTTKTTAKVTTTTKKTTLTTTKSTTKPTTKITKTTTTTSAILSGLSSTTTTTTTTTAIPTTSGPANAQCTTATGDTSIGRATYSNTYTGQRITNAYDVDGDSGHTFSFLIDSTTTTCDAIGRCVRAAASASNYGIDIHRSISTGAWNCTTYFDQVDPGEFRNDDDDVEIAYGYNLSSVDFD